MSVLHGWKRLCQYDKLIFASSRRALHHDSRNRLSTFWTPTQSKGLQAPAEAAEHGHDLLLRAGFLRQAHSGIFHLLPLGLRVQDKLEQLLDKHMRSLGASKVSLSSISSQKLWRKSGRLEGRDSEFFKLNDRKDAKYLLSPTHEEEITNIVTHAVHSYKDLPLRLYQISRKYRDEARPRQGLLRGREFVMKDLYTFDLTEEQALSTYEDARAAYKAFLDELGIPYLVANADSGNMGGDRSHEYHFVSLNGEDTIISCDECALSMNEELYVGKFNEQQVHDWQDSIEPSASNPRVPFQVYYGRLTKPALSQHGMVSPTGTILVQIFLPGLPFEINMHAIKRLVPGLDTSEALDMSALVQGTHASTWTSLRSIRDPRVSLEVIEAFPSYSKLPSLVKSDNGSMISANIEKAPYLLTKARAEDPCPSCGASGTLRTAQAVEIGHTFHLGKRYSTPLEAMVQSENNELVAMQMGCHGIGVSRLIGAAASLLADEKGLNWPVSIAPFTVLITGVKDSLSTDVVVVYDQVCTGSPGMLDAVIDDREKSIGWKLNDADLIGYPFIVVLGKAWNRRRAVELQCRRLAIKEEVLIDELAQRIRTYSDKL